MQTLPAILLGYYRERASDLEWAIHLHKLRWSMFCVRADVMQVGLFSFSLSLIPVDLGSCVSLRNCGAHSHFSALAQLVWFHDH